MRHGADGGDILWVHVTGPCMEPAVRMGSIEPAVRTREFHAGDVALIQGLREATQHRLVARIRIGRRTWWIHAGDASGLPGIAAQEQVVARLIRPRRILRRPRWIALFCLAAFVGAQLLRAGIPVRPFARASWKLLRRRLRPRAAAGQRTERITSCIRR